MKKMLTGNEAIARGSYEAGGHFAAAYPGTPSTEILENIATYEEILAEWAPNEKVALETVIGVSLVGGRAIASMKHVGVNVAADPLFTYAYAGVLGGMILVSADEPGMHSSQNEQDNRNYAPHAKIPMFEPSNSQEAKDFIKDAFELSEKYDTPVLFRVTTRVCHSKGIVELGERQEVPLKEYEKNVAKNVAVPSQARVNRVRVEKRLKALEELSNGCKWNYPIYNRKEVGVITSGGVFEYAQEVFGEEASYLKIGLSFPLPTTLIEDFAKEVETLYIIEENDPYLENHVRALGIDCQGKELFPSYGEMTPDVIRKAVYGQTLDSSEVNQEKLISRPPTFCAGCPHRGFFLELGKRKDTIIAGDIGCYSLAFTAPYNAMDWIVCMGAGFSTAHGAQKLLNTQGGNKKRLVGVMGDSTFFHTGINSLLNVAYNNSNTISVILDNRITGMTGGQDNPGSGYGAQGEIQEVVDIERLVRACGIKHVWTVDPNNRSEVKEAFNEAYLLDEPSVIITKWPCVLKRDYRKEDQEAFPEVFHKKCRVLTDKCVGCKKCLKTGCPALGFDKGNKKSFISPASCVGCEVCLRECPFDAIVKEGQ